MLDRYLIDACIGRGGMAEVYHGRLLRMGGFEREVAVKVLLPQLSGESEFVNMLLDEARIAATICHPNVVQVLDVGQSGEVFYLVMEFVDGTDLRSIERRHERGRVPEEPLLYITAEVLRGMEAIHSARDASGQPRRIVHRDVTPSNVLITRGGSVKLADFGIAHATGRLTHTRHGAVKGKTRYMAPEQLDGRPIDSRTDLFAVGVVLLEALLGRDAADAWHQTAMGPIFKIPLRLPPGVPPDIAAILQRALHEKAAERYQDAAEFRRDLLRALHVRGVRRGDGPAFGADELEAFLQVTLSKPELPTRPATEGRSRRDEPSLPSQPSQPSGPSMSSLASGPSAGSSILGLPLPPSVRAVLEVDDPALLDMPTLRAGDAAPLGAVEPPTAPAASVTLPAVAAITLPSPVPAPILPSPGPGPGAAPAPPALPAPPPGAPTVTLPVLSAAAQAQTQTRSLSLGNPALDTLGEATTPLGPTPAALVASLAGAPSTKVRLSTLADEAEDEQPATVVTAQVLHPPVSVSGAQQHLPAEGVPDLRRSPDLRETLRKVATSTLVRDVRARLDRLSGGRLTAKLLYMVGAGLIIGGIGVAAVMRATEQPAERPAPVLLPAPQDLAVPPPPPPPALAQRASRLQVIAPAGTRVNIDGVWQRELAPRTYEVPPGSHKVRLNPPRGHKDSLRSVEVPAGGLSVLKM
jgi:serine/threonine-protein kinase